MTTIMAPISGRYFINEGSWHSTTLRTVPGACKHSRSLSYNCLLQDTDLIHRPGKLKQRSGCWGWYSGGWVELCRSPLPGTAWSSHMESQPCWGTGSPLTDQVGWDWTKWPLVGVWGLSPGHSLSSSISPDAIFFSVSPFLSSFLLLPLKPDLHLLSLACGHSPPRDQEQIWHESSIHFLTPWPSLARSKWSLVQQSPPSPEMVGPPWRSASCIPHGRWASCQEGVCLLFFWLSLFSHIHLTWGSFWSPDMPSWLHLLLTGAEKSSPLWF